MAELVADPGTRAALLADAAATKVRHGLQQVALGRMVLDGTAPMTARALGTLAHAITQDRGGGPDAWEWAVVEVQSIADRLGDEVAALLRHAFDASHVSVEDVLRGGTGG